MPKKSAVKKHILPLPEGVTVGELVRYYFNGWRVGRLVKVEGNDAGLHAIGTYRHEAAARLKWVHVSDLKSISTKGETKK